MFQYANKSCHSGKLSNQYIKYDNQKIIEVKMDGYKRGLFQILFLTRLVTSFFMKEKGLNIL